MSKITNIGNNSLTYIFTLIKQYVTGVAAKKVDVIEGKGLSTNDLTTELKTNYDAAYTHSTKPHAPADAQANIIESIKVNGQAQAVTGKSVNLLIESGSDNNLTNDLKANYDAAYTHSTSAHAPANAQVNVIESVKVNGAPLSVVEKGVNVTVPTKVSELANDSSFVTDSGLTAKGYQTAGDVDARIKAVVGAAPEALDTLGEIATALNNNADFAGTMTAELAKKANTADFVEMTNEDVKKLWDSVVA